MVPLATPNYYEEAHKVTVTVVRIHIEVPDDLHRRAKAAAAMQGVTLKDFVIQALEDAINQAPEPGGAGRGG